MLKETTRDQTTDPLPSIRLVMDRRMMATRSGSIAPRVISWIASLKSASVSLVACGFCNNYD